MSDHDRRHEFPTITSRQLSEVAGGKKFTGHIPTPFNDAIKRGVDWIGNLTRGNR